MAVAQGRALGAAGAELAADERGQGQRWRRQTRLPDPGGGRHRSRRSGLGYCFVAMDGAFAFQGRAEQSRAEGVGGMGFDSRRGEGEEAKQQQQWRQGGRENKMMKGSPSSSISIITLCPLQSAAVFFSYIKQHQTHRLPASSTHNKSDPDDYILHV